MQVYNTCERMCMRTFGLDWIDKVLSRQMGGGIREIRRGEGDVGQDTSMQDDEERFASNQH